MLIFVKKKVLNPPIALTFETLSIYFKAYLTQKYKIQIFIFSFIKNLKVYKNK